MKPDHMDDATYLRNCLERGDWGKNEWNSWRDEVLEENPRHRLKLNQFDFRGYDISGLNLENADLRRADFLGATECLGLILSRADLAGAHIRPIKLTECVFCGAAGLHPQEVLQALEMIRESCLDRDKPDRP